MRDLIEFLRRKSDAKLKEDALDVIYLMSINNIALKLKNFRAFRQDFSFVFEHESKKCICQFYYLIENIEVKFMYIDAAPEIERFSHTGIIEALEYFCNGGAKNETELFLQCAEKALK